MAHDHEVEQGKDLELDNLTKVTNDKTEHNHSDDYGHDHEHGSEEKAGWKSN